MDLVPPWSLAKRQEWAEAHPWLASVYGALGGSLPLVYMAVTASDRFALFLLICLWLSVPLLALVIKRRWGQRLDAEAHPRPTLRRLWSRTSDRWLSRFMWFYTALAVVSVFGLLSEEDRGSSAIVLLLSVIVVATARSERRRRSSP